MNDSQHLPSYSHHSRLVPFPSFYLQIERSQLGISSPHRHASRLNHATPKPFRTLLRNPTRKALARRLIHKRSQTSRRSNLLTVRKTLRIPNLSRDSRSRLPAHTRNRRHNINITLVDKRLDLSVYPQNLLVQLLHHVHALFQNENVRLA